MMLYIGITLFGGVLAWCIFTIAVGALHSRRDRVWEDVRFSRSRIVIVLLCAILNGWFVAPLIADATKRAEGRHVAYMASLKRVTVVVTDVEPIPYANVVNQVRGWIILTEEFPRQKIIIPSRQMKKVSVGDMLDLKLDGWDVIEAGYGETMPIPHGK